MSGVAGSRRVGWAALAGQPCAVGWRMDGEGTSGGLSHTAERQGRVAGRATAVIQRQGEGEE